MSLSVRELNILPQAAEDAKILTVDLGKSKEEIVEDIRKSALDTGFFYLTGFEEPTQQMIADAMEQVAKWTDQDDDAKRPLKSSHATGNRGWMLPTDFPTPDGKESFFVGPTPEDFTDPEEKKSPLVHPNVWPDEEQWPEFKPKVETLKHAFNRLSLKMIRLMALAMNFEEERFDKDFEVQLAVMNMLRYYQGPNDPTANKFGALSHTDWGIVTLLATTGPGLEIYHRDLEKWQRVPFNPEALVINLGDLMERWTGKKFRSTIHRVCITDDSLPRRQSIGYFVQPRPGCVVECIDPEMREEYPTLTFAEYMTMRFKALTGGGGKK